MTSVQSQRRAPPRAANKRKRESSAMRILPRPIGAVILIAVAAAAYGGYERLWHRHPSRACGSSQTGRKIAHAPRPASRHCGGSSVDGTDAGRTPRAYDLSTAGRLRRLADQDLSRMLEAGAAARRRRCLCRAGAPRLQPGRLAVEPAKLVNPPSDPALKPQAKSVLAAVQNCNPLPVPAQYRPFYEQWKTKTIHFDPQVAAR